jgi:hypothetical protein
MNVRFRPLALLLAPLLLSSHGTRAQEAKDAKLNCVVRDLGALTEKDLRPRQAPLEAPSSPLISPEEFREYELSEFDKTGPDQSTLEILRRLGYSEDRTPSFEQFARAYDDASAQLIAPGQRTVSPAKPYRRQTPQGYEYQFVLTAKEPPPSGEGWEAFDVKRVFSIPPSVIRRELKEGKYPLVDGSHDASHFAGFLKSPHYGPSIVQLANDTRLPPNEMEWTLQHLLEVLAFPLEKNRKAIRNASYYLKHAQKTKPPLRIESVKEVYSSLSNEQLISVAKGLKGNNHLSEYLGGAISRPSERKLRLSPSSRTYDPLTLVFKIFESRTTGLTGANHASLLSFRHSIQKLLEMLSMDSKALSELTGRNSVYAQHYLDLPSPHGDELIKLGYPPERIREMLRQLPPEVHRAKTLELLREVLVRYEYGLLKAQEIGLKEYILGFGDASSESYRYIKDVYGVD